MKQHILFAAMATFVVWTMADHAHGQITVNEGDLPQGGADHVFQNLTPDLLLDFETSGPGWIWDFSDLEPVDSTVVGVQDIGDASFTALFTFDNAFLYPEVQADHFYTFLNIPDLGDVGGDAGGAAADRRPPVQRLPRHRGRRVRHGPLHARVRQGAERPLR